MLIIKVPPNRTAKVVRGRDACRPNLGANLSTSPEASGGQISLLGGLSKCIVVGSEPRVPGAALAAKRQRPTAGITSAPAGANRNGGQRQGVSRTARAWILFGTPVVSLLLGLTLLGASPKVLSALGMKDLRIAGHTFPFLPRAYVCVAAVAFAFTWAALRKRRRTI